MDESDTTASRLRPVGLRATLESGLDDAQKTLIGLEQSGIPEEVTTKLLNEGLEVLAGSSDRFERGCRKQHEKKRVNGRSFVGEKVSRLRPRVRRAGQPPCLRCPRQKPRAARASPAQVRNMSSQY